jgi:hypothetical protein
LSLFSDEKEHEWRNDNKSRELVESAAFRLLSQLCDGSLKGRNAVAAARCFQGCFDRAQNILSCTTLKRTSKEEIEMEDSDLETSAAGDEKKEGKKMDSVSDEILSAKISSTFDIENEKLLSSAFSFVSTMVQISTVRSNLLKNEEFVMSAATFATDGKFPNLQFEAVKVIARLVSCTSADGILPPDRVGSIFQSVLAAEAVQDGDFSSGSNTNLLRVLAAEGMEYIFDSLSEMQQKSVIKDVASQYRKVLKIHSITRSSNKGSDLDNGGVLAYNLTTIMMMANCKGHLEECFDPALVTSLINTVQWRYDPKTVIAKEELPFWDATTTHSLQIISCILRRDEGRLEKCGLRTRSLLAAVLMVARPGKAPRKAIDFPSALSIVAEHGEAAASLAVKRIQKCLGI